MRVAIESGPPFGGDVWDILTCPVNILSVNGINMFKYSPLALRIPPGGSPYLNLDTHFRLFFVPNCGSIFDVVFGLKGVTLGPQNTSKCPQRVIHKCVSTTTCPKNNFCSLFIRFWTSSIHVNERLVSTPCSFSHFHPIATFHSPKLEKCQNWVQNGAPNQTKCHQNAIQNTCIFQSCF